MPAAHGEIGKPAHVGAKALAAADRQFVDGGAEPAMPASRAYVAVVLMLVVAIGRVVSALLVDKRTGGDGVGAIGSLVVGKILGVGIGRVEGEAVVQAMRELSLNGVIVRLGRRAACGNGIEVGERMSAERLAAGQRGGGLGELVILRLPDQVPGVQADIRDARAYIVAEVMVDG